MSEIPRDFRAVTPIQNFNPKQRGVGEYMPVTVRCEDCPAAEVCKKINNFRPSCDPMSGKKPTQSDVAEKCIAGTNLLLWKLLELMSRER